MGIDIRLPNISASTDAGQLAQIRSYLYQFAEQMQWALNTIEKGQSSEAIEMVSAGGAPVKTSESEAQSTFNSIKSLIIKSADIVDAYYEEIDNLLDLNGKYVAQSDFGTYVSETNQTIGATSTQVSQNLTKIETITSDVDGIINGIREKDSYIHYGYVGTTLDDTGLATEDAPGIEIGDFTTLDDGETVQTIKRFARFTAYGLELFGESMDYPVAYIKQSKLFITNAEFTGTVIFGGYKVDTSNGLAFKWVGR